MTRILIMESDVKFSQQLADTLQAQGSRTTQCHDVNKGIMMTLSENFDLILFDVLLTTVDGISLLQRLRIRKQTPVIILSPFNTTESRIKSFQQGADDYVPKPIDLVEITLRVNALLRRTMVGENINKRVIDIDQLTLLKSEQQVLYNGDELALTPIQFRLLWILVENRYQVLSKPFLYQAVLNRQFSCHDRSLEMHLSRVRRKLAEVGMSVERFATVHGKGYRFS